MSDALFTVPISYPSRDGASTVNAKLWLKDSFGSPSAPGPEKPRAVIQIVHGMAEHIDRYDDLARYLVGRGFAVCANDHVGHGRTEARPELLGHMPLHGGKEVLIADVDALRRQVAQCYPGVPYVMYGHSMGSFITRCYAARHGEGLAACVLTGTGHIPVPVSKAGAVLARAIAAVKGETYRSKLVDGMGAGAYGAQIENARTELDWLSRDEAVVDRYRVDPRCGFMFTVGGYATLLDLTTECMSPAWAARVPSELPILLASGDGDPVGSMGAGVEQAAKLLRDAGAQAVHVILYEGMRHEIHNEYGRERVYDDVATWIEGAVGARAS